MGRGGQRSVVLAAVVALTLALGACSSSGGGDDEGATGDDSATTVAAADGTSLPEVVCVSGPVESGVIPADQEVEVDCDEEHLLERFELSTSEIDQCLEVIRANSDLTIGESSFDGDPAIDDERVVGHEYSSVAGEGATCEITLAEPQSGALLGAS